MAFQAPYPAAIEDCYAALLDLKEHAGELQINSSQIMVGGESAGGGLAAEVDVYHNNMHAFDMLDPDSELARTAAEKFNQHFAYAMEHYFCE